MASRNAAMISGERSANRASSCRRSAGASCEAAWLKCSTRPARSSSTAASGMPPTTACTTGISAGRAPTRSSATGAVCCRCQGTSAAPVMTRNTAAACTTVRPPNIVTPASTSAAAISTIADRRSRSDHGAKPELEDAIVMRGLCSARAGLAQGAYATGDPEPCAGPCDVAASSSRCSAAATRFARRPTISSRSESKMTEMIKGTR